MSTYVVDALLVQDVLGHRRRVPPVKGIPIRGLVVVGDGDALPQVLVGPSEGFRLPLAGDGVVEDLDVPVWLVGQALHDQHHSHLTDEQHLRVGAVAVVVDAHRVHDEVVAPRLAPVLRLV